MIYNAYQDTKIGIGGISIVSAGHIFAQQGRRICRMNGRKDFLLFYVSKGSECIELDGEIVMHEGSFVIFKPNEKQVHTQRESKISEFYYVHFNAPDDFDLFGFRSSTVYSVEPSAQINEMFEQIIEELQNKRPVYEKMCVSKLFGILALLERRYTRQTTTHFHYVDKISFVIQNMNKEYDKGYTLDDYAKMCNMGSFHFLRIFKKITGTTPIEYRNTIRIEHAKEMLEDTDELIDEIGRKLGYASNVYFCNAFKLKVGVSPTQYRKSCRKELYLMKS